MLSLISSGAKQIRRNAMVSDDMVHAIEMWERMYRGEVPWRTAESDEWLNLPCKIANEIATKVTNEAQIRIQPSEQETAPESLNEQQSQEKAPAPGTTGRKKPRKPHERWEYIDKAFKPIRKRLAIYAEYACAFGGICFKPYINGNNQIAIGVFNASRFYPTEFIDGEEVQSGFFLDQKKQEKYWYCRVEQHTWDGVSKYRVENNCYRAQTADDLGQPCPLTEVDEWQNISPVVVIENVFHPLFSYFGIPLGNTVDQSSPLGVSVYHRAKNSIKTADKQYQSLLWEYEAGEMAVDISEDALGIDSDGKNIVPQGKDRLFRTNGLPVSGGGGGELIKTFSPTLRDGSYISGLQTILKCVEDDACLARGTFSDPNVDARTATEVRQSKVRTYDTVCKIQKSFSDALERLAYAIDAMATLYNLCPPGNWAYTANWDDSVIEDSETERMNDRDDVSSGLMMEWEYRVKWYGETQEQAKKILAEKVKPSDNEIMGFNDELPLDSGSPAGAAK